MTYETHNRRNWRASRTDKSSKEYRYFRLLEKMFYYYHRIKKAVEEVKRERGYYQSTGKQVAAVQIMHSSVIPLLLWH